MNNLEEIGSAILTRRKDLNVSQQDLAEMAGVSERTIRVVEGGTGNPSLETLLKIGEVLGMELTMKIKQSD